MARAPDTMALAELREVLVAAADMLFPSGDGRYLDALRSGFRQHAVLALASIAKGGSAKATAEREILALEAALRESIAPGLTELLRGCNPFAVEMAPAAHRRAQGSITLADAASVAAAALEWERRTVSGRAMADAVASYARATANFADHRASAIEDAAAQGEPVDFAEAATDMLRLDAVVWALESLGAEDAVRQVRRSQRRFARGAMQGAVARIRADDLAGAGRVGDGARTLTDDLDDITVLAQRVIEGDAEEIAEGRDPDFRTVGWNLVHAFGKCAEEVAAGHIEAILQRCLSVSDEDTVAMALREVGALVRLGRSLSGPQAPSVFDRLSRWPGEQLAVAGRMMRAKASAQGRPDLYAEPASAMIRACLAVDWQEGADRFDSGYRPSDPKAG